MPCPKTVGELFKLTWPKAEQVHDVEQYLDSWLEEHGGEYPPAKEHNFIATGDMLRKAAAKPRRRRKTAANNRVQLTLPIQ